MRSFWRPGAPLRRPALLYVGCCLPSFGDAAPTLHTLALGPGRSGAAAATMGAALLQVQTIWLIRRPHTATKK